LIRFDRLDRLGAIVGLVLAVLLFPLRFFASQIYIETLPIVLGVACILYLLADRRERSTGLPTFSRSMSRLLPAIVFGGTALLPLLALQAGRRTEAFYAVAAMTATVLLFQVLFTPDGELSPSLVLAEALLFGVVVRFAALTTTPGYIGIDVWTHMRFVDVILADRSLDPISDRKYYAAPLFHLLVAGGSLLFESTPRTALYATAGLVTLLPVLLVYSLGRLLMVRRWALAAAVIYSFSDHFMRWGLHVIPTNLGLVLFCAFLLFFGRVVHTQFRARDYMLLVGFSIAIVLTHQISTFITLLVLGVGMVARTVVTLVPFFERQDSLDRVLSIPDPPKQAGLFLFNLGFATFTWSLTPYRGDTFLTTVTSFFVETVASSAGFLNLVDGGGPTEAAAADQAPQALVTLVTYIDEAGFLLLLLLGVVGCLYVVHGNRATHLTVTLGGSLVVMLVFVLGLPLFGIRNFVPGRWFAFLYVPLVLLGLAGVRYLTLRLPRGATAPVIAVLLIVLPGVMLIASPAVADSPPFEDVQTRYGYSDAELEAVDATGRYLEGDRTLYTDHPYQTVVERTGSQPAEPATMPANDTHDHDLVMYRGEQSWNPVYFRDEEGNAYRRIVEPSEMCEPSMHTVYDNGVARLCTR
jgi:hypothetical protein